MRNYPSRETLGKQLYRFSDLKRTVRVSIPGWFFYIFTELHFKAIHWRGNGNILGWLLNRLHDSACITHCIMLCYMMYLGRFWNNVINIFYLCARLILWLEHTLRPAWSLLSGRRGMNLNNYNGRNSETRPVSNDGTLPVPQISTCWYSVE